MIPVAGILAELYFVDVVCRSKDERDRLSKWTGIPEAVAIDLTNIQKEYKDIVLPFITLHHNLWDPERHTLYLYRSMVAFVMAYR